MLCRPEGSGFRFSASLSCFFNFLFFYFTNNRSEENHPQMLQPWSKSMCSSAPRGRNCVEGRCNNRDVLETPPEVLRNIHVPWKYSLFFFCPPLSPQADTSASSTHYPGKGRASHKFHKKEKVNFDLGVSGLKLTAQFRAKTFASQKLNRKPLLQLVGHRKGESHSVCHTQQAQVRKTQ